MTSAALSMTKNTTFYAIYSGSVSNRYWNTSSYTTRTLYRNEFFKSNSALDVRLSTTNNSTTNYTPESGIGGSTWLGLSTSNDTTAEYNSVESAASSTSTSLYTIYQFSITYEKGSNVSAIGKTGDTCKVTSGTSCNVTLPTITPNTGYTSVGWSTTSGATTGVTGTYTISTSGGKLYANAKGSTYTATFYYYDGTQINTTISNCTVANTEGNCTVSVPVAVQSSTGPYGSPYKGVSDTASTMEAGSLTISTNGTKFYANYSSGDATNTKVTRYYYSSGYKSNTIYRNEYFISDNAISTVLSTADNGTTNYTSSKGPGSSNWLGLSTAKDTTPEYSTVQAAANSTSKTLYTVYQFVINYQKGSNVSAVGSDSATCNVTTSDTSCSVILPTITPNTGYTSVGWSTENGATTGQAALTTYTLTANNRVLYANAVAANYLNTTTNESYMTLKEAFNSVSNNQTIKVLIDTTETTQATLADTKTGIKLDLNGKTITSSASRAIENNGTLDIYNTSSTTGIIECSSTYTIYNNGTLTLNGTSSTNKIVIDKTTNNNGNGVIYNLASKSLTVNKNVEVKVSAGSSYGILNHGIATINGGSITGSSFGVNNQPSGQLNISESSTQITGSSTGIQNFGTATISGGTIMGNSIGIDSRESLTISGNNTQIIGTSKGIFNGGTATITGGKITGTIGIDNDINNELNISGNNTQIIGTSSYGIYNKGIFRMSEGTITGSSYGIYNYSGTANNSNFYGNITFTGGTIQSSSNHAIYIYKGAILTLGTKDSSVSVSSPLVQTTGTSNKYGVYIDTTGTFNFYDGIVKSSSGTGYAISGTVSDTPDGYHVYKETTGGVESAYLTNTKRTATFYYNSNTTSGGLTIATKTVSCNVTSGNSCTVSVPSEVSNSVGEYNSTYKGVGSSGSMSSASLTISENKNFFAYYSSPLKINYINSSGSIVNTSSLLYRNEYFTSTTALATITASSQSSTTQTTSISLSNLKGTFKGITSTINSTTNYAVNNTTIINSNATTYYAVSSTTKNITFYSGYNGSSHAKTDTVVQTLTHYIKTTSTTGVSNGSITTPTLNSISNWTSLGWRDDTVAGAKEYSSGTSITPAYSEYHAVYSRNITYTYNAAGGSGTVSNTTHTVYLNSSNPSLSSQESTLSTQEFTKSGYSFGGWMIDGTTVAAGGHYTPDPLLSYNGTTYAWTISATAQWASNTATIKVFKDGLAWSDRQIEVDETTEEVIEVDLSTSPTQYTSAGITAVISPDSNEIVFNNTVSGTTYYIYASKHNLATKMMINTGFTITGGVSQEKSINYYTITRSQGTGTSLETKWDSASGDAFSHNPIVLGNNKVTIYAKSAVAGGYLTNTTLSLKHGTTNMTASGDTFSVNGTETITSTSSNPEPITYTVTYHSNPSACGTPTGVMSPSTHTYGTPKNLSANEFTSSTCVFQGWNTLSNGTGEIYSDEEEVLNLSQTNNGNIDLYAQWQGIEYVVAFDGNDATSGEMEDLLVHYGETFTLPENEYTKIGYSYGNGWSTSSDGEKVYNEEQTNVSNLTDQANETVTLYSVWNPHEVTVNYYKDDSCSTDLVESVTKHYNELFGPLPTPNIPGYDFVEWNTSANGTGTTITDESIVDTLENSINVCAIKTPKTIKIKYDNNYQLTNNGYYNTSWSANGLSFDATLNKFVFLGPIDNDYVTLEATFKPNITTTYEAYDVVTNFENGGSGIYLKEGKIMGSVHVNGAYTAIDSGVTYQNNTQYTAALTFDGSHLRIYVNGALKSSKELSGVLTPSQHKTTMAIGLNPIRDIAKEDPFEGTVSSVRIYDRGLTSTEVLKNYNATDDKGIVYDGLLKYINSTHRAINEVEILREYDGGTLGTTLAPNLPSPGRAFYGFAGWYTEPECTNQVTASTPMPTEDTTYYAKWTPNKIQVEYYSNGATTFKGSTSFSDPVSRSNEILYTNQTTWSSNGLGNYSGSGGAYYMTKTDSVATGNWLVGSNTSSTKIHEDRIFYGAPGLADLVSRTYSDSFRTNSSSTTVVPLYAEWTTGESCAKVTLNKQCGTGGTTTFYYKPGTNTYYSNNKCTTALSTPITMPTSDFTIKGYYEAPLGHGKQFIDDSGNPINSLYKVKYDQTLYAKCSTTLYEYYQLNSYDYDSSEYANTNYKVNWSRNFILYSRFSVPSLGKRYLILGNYDGSDVNALNIEVSADNKMRVYTGNSETNESTVSSATIPANTNLQVMFRWLVDSKGWYLTVTNLSDSSTVATIASYASPHSWTSASGYSVNPLRAGTVDYRSGTSPFNPLSYSYLQTRSIRHYGEKLSPLPDPTIPSAEFIGWFDTSTGGAQVSSDDIVTTASPKIYAHWLPKTLELSVHKDGAAWSSSGMKVALYQNNVEKYSGTITTGSAITINNIVPGTYDVYASESLSAPDSVVDTGADFKVTTGGTVTVDYYTLTLNSGTGISSVEVNNTTDTSGVFLKGKTIPIEAGVQTDYKFTSWTKNTGSSPASATSASTNVVLNAKTTLTANAAKNKVNVTIKKDGAAWSSSGMKVALYQSGTSKYTLTTSGSVASKEGITAGTYDIYAYKNDSNTTYADTGVDVKVSTGTVSATINYYTLTLSKGTGVDSVSGAGIYLNKQKPTIKATMKTNYKFNEWTVSSGVSPASLTSATTTVTMTKKTSLSATSKRTWNDGHTHTFYTSLQATKKSGWLFDNYRIAKYHFTGNWECSCGRTHKANTSVYGYHLQCVYCGLTERELESKLGYQIDGRYWCPITGNERTNHNYSY